MTVSFFGTYRRAILQDMSSGLVYSHAIEASQFQNQRAALLNTLADNVCQKGKCNINSPNN